MGLSCLTRKPRERHVYKPSCKPCVHLNPSALQPLLFATSNQAAPLWECEQELWVQIDTATRAKKMMLALVTSGYPLLVTCTDESALRYSNEYLSQGISGCRGILPILVPSYSSSQLFSLVNFQKTGKDFQKTKIDISYLAWNVCIESDRLHPNPLGMKNAKFYLALNHNRLFREVVSGIPNHSLRHGFWHKSPCTA